MKKSMRQESSSGAVWDPMPSRPIRVLVRWLPGVITALLVCHHGQAQDINNYLSVSASPPTAAVPSLTVRFSRADHWALPKTNAVLYRSNALEGTTSWGTPIATLPWGTTTFVDTNVVVGQRYLYRLTVDGPTNTIPRTLQSFVTGGIATPAVEHRGIMLLVTDTATAPLLVPEIDRFKQDLIGDGYRVQPISVAPTETPQSVKAKIVAAYQADPGQVKAVTLLGNIPIAYSGWVNPDGHGPRPFPTDSYYADIDGTWTDSTRNSNNTAGNRSWWVNTPGDGKFDQNTTPSAVDLQIGRINFDNLPAFPQSEVELMRRYLDKNHAYRQGQFTFNKGIYVGVTSDTAYAACGPLFGTDYRPFVQTEVGTTGYYPPYWDEQATNGYWLTTWVRGGGAYTSTWGIGGTQDYAAASAVNTAIHAAWASYYGEWDVANAFLQGMLAARGQTVGVFYDESPSWLLYALAMGETMGYAARMSINQTGVALDPRSAQYADSIVSSLLGDPSIRFFPIKPPTSAAGLPGGNTVSLSWQASPDPAVGGYHVYRASELDGNFVRINDAPVNGTTFIDNSPLESNIYMIRALKLQETGSGSYYDLSQGTFTGIVTANGNGGGGDGDGDGDGDADGDGMPDTWEQTHFGTIGASDGTGDFDGDGSRDRHEYLAGTDPNNIQSRLKIESTTLLGESQLVISFSAVAGKTYELLSSSTLQAEDWQTDQSGITGISPTTSVTVPVSGTKKFFKIRVE